MSEPIDRPESPDSYRWAGQVRPRRRLIGRTIAVAGVTIALIAGILIGRELGPAGVEPASSPSPTAAAIGSPSPSGTDPPATASPAPTPQQTLAVSGELPPPAAPLPPMTPVIPRLSTIALVETAVSLGFTCDSGRVFESLYFWLLCEGISARTNARYTLSADFATRESVSGVHVSINDIVDVSRQPGDPTPQQTAERILVPFARLLPTLPGAAAEQWIGNPRCTGYPDCIRSSEGVSVMVISGARPGLIIYPTPIGPTAVPSSSGLDGLPGPDANVPPGVDVITGLSVDEILTAATSVGLACEAGRGAIPGSSRLHYVLTCVGLDPAGNAEYRLTAQFWNQDAIFEVHADVAPSLDLPILDPTAAVRGILPFVDLVGDQTARRWVQRNMDDPLCGRDPCARNLGRVYFYAQWGRNGSRSLFIEPAR